MAGGHLAQALGGLMKPEANNLWYLIAPIIWGAVISVAPVPQELGLLLALLVISPFSEYRITKKVGFLPWVPLRAGVLVSVIGLAIVAPTKWENTVLNPQLLEFEDLGPVVFLKSPDQPFSVELPPGTTLEQLNLPERQISIGSLIQHIERATGLELSTGMCGTGATILFGTFPIGSTRYVRNAANRPIYGHKSAKGSAAAQRGAAVTFDRPPLFAGGKTAVASNAPELRR